jgi:hypothetical protein
MTCLAIYAGWFARQALGFMTPESEEAISPRKAAVLSFKMVLYLSVAVSPLALIMAGQGLTLELDVALILALYFLAALVANQLYLQLLAYLVRRRLRRERASEL